MKITVLADELAVCRLGSEKTLPAWAKMGAFFSVTRTPDEISVVCSQENVPENLPCEKNWRALKVEGPLDFSLVGILADISAVLAGEEISIFAVSTYDTDYILLKSKDVQRALQALAAGGYGIKT